jgi:Haem-degrading
MAHAAPKSRESGDAFQTFPRLYVGKETAFGRAWRRLRTRRSRQHRGGHEAGELLAFSRMDGARSYTVELASEKARGAAKLGLPTAALEQLWRRTASGNPWMRGGKPVLCDGQCAGAIGVSGAKPEVDEEIVEWALASLDAVP